MRKVISVKPLSDYRVLVKFDNIFINRAIQETIQRDDGKELKLR